MKVNCGANIAVRASTAADLPGILVLVRGCDEAPPWSEAVWRQLTLAATTVETGRMLFLAQGNDGALCGLLTATCLAEETELESVLVASAARRKGVGRRLTQAWLARAKTGGARVAMLEVRESNDAAMALYRSLGFTPQGRRLRYYQNPVEDAVLMRRQIDPG